MAAKINAVKRKRDNEDSAEDSISPLVMPNLNTGTIMQDTSRVASKPNKAKKPVVMKRAPPRRLPVKVKKHNVWDKLSQIDAGLSISDWLSLDKTATKEMLDGIRTLRSRRRRVTPTLSKDEDVIMVDNVLHATVPAEHPMRVAVIEGDDSDSSSDSWSSDSEDDSNTSMDSVDGSDSSFSILDSETQSAIGYPYSLPEMRASAPLRFPISVNGKVIFAIGDSGAAVSVMNKGLADRLGLQCNGDHMNLVAFDDYKLAPSSISPNVPVIVGFETGTYMYSRRTYW